MRAPSGKVIRVVQQVRPHRASMGIGSIAGLAHKNRTATLESGDALGLPLPEDDICDATLIQELTSTSDG